MVRHPENHFPRVPLLLRVADHLCFTLDRHRILSYTAFQREEVNTVTSLHRGNALAKAFSEQGQFMIFMAASSPFSAVHPSMRDRS